MLFITVTDDGIADAALFKKRFHSLDDDTVSGLLTMYPNRSVAEWETMLDAEVTPSDVDDLLFGNIGMNFHTIIIRKFIRLSYESSYDYYI